MRILSVFFTLLTLGVLQAEPVSTRPPKDYASTVAPLLTPLEKALQDAGEPPKEAENGWIILDEEMHHVRADGTRLFVRHQICRAISQSGAEMLGREVEGYRLSSQSPHLALARSIQPDGRRQDVRPEACFLQTPQREADHDLYNDSGEMVIIFPNVKPGTVTEFITVLEEKKPRIPGHYTTYHGFRLGWPVRLLRAITDLPADYAKRLSLTPLGAGVPEPEVKTLANGRQRWTWQIERTPPSFGEPGRAPFGQTGPLVRLSTLKDWTEFVTWYRPLVEKQLKLGKKLEAEVEKWTAQASTPREVLDILHRHVANDVRYVGLEFGGCDIEPHTASEVWEHQYGDCKDKAALLVAMLRHKKVPAHLVLVNTEHLGRVERRCTDWRAFNHAILVAELPDGPVFCDPTIEGSPVGMLSPSSAERDVLVISTPERWMRTPEQTAGVYGIHLDAKLSSTGEFSGWATLEAEGYYGNSYRNLVATSTRQQLKERLQNLVEEIWQGASVIDVKTMPQQPSMPYQLQAFFIVPPGGSPSLRFPFDADFLPDLGTGEDRETDAFLWRDINRTRSVISLPPGLQPASLPPPLTVKNKHGSGQARWNLDGGKLRAELSFEVKSSRIPADEVKAFMGELATLRAWLDKPVTLQAIDGSDSPARTAPADPLADFPRMPSGEGQLDLVAERFPLNGDLKLRRAAYEKAIEFFPKDARTRFLAETQIAYIEYMETKHAEAVRRLRGLLDSPKGEIPADDGALARYMLAISLRELKQDTEALALLDALIADKALSAFRRAWSLTVRSQMLEEKEPEKALQAARDGLALHSGDVDLLLQRVCLLRAKLKQADGLKTDLLAFLEKETQQTAQQMRALASSVNDHALEKPEEARLIASVLAPLGAEDVFGKEFAQSLASAEVRAKTQGQFTDIRARLQAWLAAHPESMPAWDVPAKLKTPEDFIQAIEEALKRGNNDWAELTRLSVELLTRFEPGSWYGDRLWKAVTYIDLLDRKEVTAEPPPLMIQLIEQCEATPPESDTHVEGRFLRALMLHRRSKLDEEGAILRDLITRPGIDDGYRLSAIDRAAENARKRGHPQDAIAAYRELKKYPTYFSSATSTLEGILLALETGDEKAAFELLENLRAIEPSTIVRTSAVENVNSFLKLADDEQAMRDWWSHSAKWWPKWVEFERNHLPARDEKVPLALVIPNLSELGTEMGEDSRADRHDEALEAIRVLGHAARWQPNMAMELCSVFSLGLPTLARIAEPFRELVIAIHEEGGFTDPDHVGSVAVWAAVCHADGATPQRAVQIARDFIREKGVKEDIGITLLRVWALAAVKTGEKLEEPTETLVRHLASSTPDSDRPRSVKALARLYQKQNLRDQELALLNREVDDPRNKDGGDTLQQLRQRYEQLQDGDAGGDGPAFAVKAWLAAHRPAWYDHVRPLDLKDEKAAEPDEAMAPGNDRSLNIPEAVKLCCLVASDPDQPDQRRHAAIHYLGWYAPSIATTEAEFKAWTAALQNEKSLPRPVRAFAVWLSARRSFWSDMHPAMQHALAQPILDHLRGDQQLAELAIVRRYARVSPTDLDGTDKLAAELLKGTLQYMTLEALQRCIQRLAENGRVEAARRHYKAMSTARYDEDVADDKAAQQLAALKAINVAQKLKPAHDALKDWFLATPAVKELPGKTVPEPFQTDWAPDLPDAERLQLYRQQVEQGRWPRDDLSFWFDAAGALPRDPRQVESSLGMFRIALEKAPDDQTRGELIDAAASVVDTDDPPTLARLVEVLNPWRSRADQPETQDALRLFDLHTRLRTGQETDLFATLATLQTPPRQAAARNGVLIALVSRGDKAGARRLLDQIDPDQLLGRGMIDDALHAYRLLDLKDELELATEQLRQHLEDDLLTAWMIPHGDTAGRVIHLALQLEDASLVPEAFSKHLRSTLRDPDEKHLFEAKDAYLRQDWETTATAAARGIEGFPTLYDYHYFLGMAQARLGQKTEAIATLKTFLHYDHYSHQASQATQKLAELEK